MDTHFHYTNHVRHSLSHFQLKTYVLELFEHTLMTGISFFFDTCQFRLRKKILVPQNSISKVQLVFFKRIFYKSVNTSAASF